MYRTLLTIDTYYVKYCSTLSRFPESTGKKSTWLQLVQKYADGSDKDKSQFVSMPGVHFLQVLHGF